MFVNLLLGFAFFYLIPVFGIEPRTNLILFFAITLLLIYLWRLAFNRFIARGLFRNRLLYVGPSHDAIALRDLVAGNTLGFELVCAVHTTPRVSHDADGLHWSEEKQAIPELVSHERVNAIVLGHDAYEHPDIRESLYRSLSTSAALIDRKELEETLTGRIPLAEVDKAWFLRNLRESEKMWFEAVKRGLDLFFVIPVLLLAGIVTPFVALAIRLSSPGPVFFRQTRVGKHGREFQMIKFRTMRHDPAPQQALFASEGDPRITRVGFILRALRIDELPQVWNVLRGDMSFVGPRPEQPEFVRQLTDRMPFYPLRHLTRPGLTGWAQVKYKYAGSLEENLVKLQYDLYYVKHRSMILDLAILLKTINIVLRRQGT
jgi:exopolysaccharide biosynthesis polyprenyl glycosylphosphotransferase